MIADLPPQHPIVELNNNVYTLLKERPSLQTFLSSKYPTIRVFSTLPDNLGMNSAVYANKMFDGLSYSHTNTILYRTTPRMYNLAVKQGKRIHNTLLPNLQLVIHENLHLSVTNRVVYKDDERNIEEGAVSAVAYDLLPAITKRLYNRTVKQSDMPTPDYPACVANIRVASTIATRSKNWRATYAKRWRMSLLTASKDSRSAMPTRVGMNPNDMCNS